MKAHIIILDILKNSNPTIEELVKQTGYSKDGLRGRISEIRKKYNVVIVKKVGRYYIDSSNRVIEFVRENNLSGQAITFDFIAKKTGLSKDEIEKQIIQIFKTGKILQVAKEKVAIYLLPL